MNSSASALFAKSDPAEPRFFPSKGRGLSLLFFALILFATFALRLWNLGTQSLWHDEAWSVFSAYHPLAPGQLGTDPNAPPIFYMTLSLWQHLAGDDVWAMRYWSLIVGVITVALEARVMRHWFGDPAALLTALLLAFCPILWVFSQEIRAYVAMPLLALVLLALADALLKPRPAIPSRLWFWIATIELVTLYTHNLSVPIIAWLNVVVVTVWTLRGEWRRLFSWLALQAGIGIAYLPWLLTQSPTGTVLNTPPALHPALIWDIWQSYFTGIKAMVGADSGLMALTAIMGIIGLLSITTVILSCFLLRSATGTSKTYPLNFRQHAVAGRFAISLSRIVGRTGLVIPLSSPKGMRIESVMSARSPLSRTQGEGLGVRGNRLTIALIFSQAILIPLLNLIEILGAHIDFHPRYFVAGAPAALMVIAMAVTGIRSRYARPILALATSGLAIAIMLRMMTVTYSSPIYQHDDFRAIAEHYAQLGPGDRVIIPYGWEPTLDYYGQKMGFKDKLISIPLYSSGDKIINELETSLKNVKNAELLTWYQLPADVRGAYACILGASHQIGSMTVEGVKTDRYDLTSAFIPAYYDHILPDRLRMGALEYEHTEGGLWGSDGLCLISRWKLWQKPSENLRLSVILQNNYAWEIAKADSDILNDRQLPISYWNEGEDSEIFSFLPVPLALPCMHYPIALKMYSVGHPNGIEPQLANNGEDSWHIQHVSEYPVGTLYKSITSPDQPLVTQADIRIADGFYLHSKDVPQQPTLQQGQTFRVSLEWWNLIGREGISAVLQGDSWQDVSNFGWDCQQSQIISWHQFHVPTSATGKAILKVVFGQDHEVTLATYDIAPINRTYTAPVMIAIPTNATFTGVGTLIGLDASKHDGVTLYWRGDGTPQIAYKVFVHLLDSSGNIIAQDDSEPVGGARATTNWLKGEYITDFHNIDSVDWNRVASIRLGLYDPATGTRVLLGNGTDNVTVAIR